MSTVIELLEQALARIDAMTPEEREAMYQAQRESWARAFAPCEHGVADWEDCADCRDEAGKSRP